MYFKNLEVATSAVIVMKLIVPTRNTRFLPNLTLDWLTTAIRSTRGARRTFHSANLQESTTPCSIHGVSGNSPLISWAWVGWGRLCLKGITYILLSRPNATWLRRWHLLVNASKTVTLSFTPNHQLNITLNGTPLKQVKEHRHLGIILQNNLQWNSHVTHIINKSKKLLHQLRKTRGQLNTPSLLVIYTAYIRPVIEYGSLVLSNTTRTQKDRLERVQRRAARICLRIPLFAPVHHSSLLHHLQLPTLVSRQLLRQFTLAHNIKYIRAPLHLQQPHLARPITEQPYALQHMRTYTLRTSHTYRHTNSPINLSLHNFNQLPPDLRETNSKHAFKSMASSLILSSICSCSSSHCTPSWPHPLQCVGFLTC